MLDNMAQAATRAKNKGRTTNPHPHCDPNKSLLFALTPTLILIQGTPLEDASSYDILEAYLTTREKDPIFEEQRDTRRRQREHRRKQRQDNLIAAEAQAEENAKSAVERMQAENEAERVKQEKLRLEQMAATEKDKKLAAIKQASLVL